jgi:hypothetical protein
VTEPSGYPAHPPYQSPTPGPGGTAAEPPGQFAQKRRGTNGFAIASLIFGLIGGILLGIIFGIVALVQIRRRGQRGRGLAIAGLVLSGLWLAGLAVGLAYSISTSADRDSSGQITSEGPVTSTELAEGDCVNGLKESQQVFSLPAVPCAQPHEGEVFAVFDISAPDWPGETAVIQQAEKGCNDRLPSYAPAAADDPSLELFYLHPTKESWGQGDRLVTCMATDPAKQRTGSLRD